VQVYDASVLDRETLALLGLGYHRVFYAELYCGKCGSIRVGIELAPEERHPCPICSQSCCCASLACVGFSRRPVPFFEIVEARSVYQLHRLVARRLLPVRSKKLVAAGR
jgi:hypothetical protein